MYSVECEKCISERNLSTVLCDDPLKKQQNKEYEKDIKTLLNRMNKYIQLMTYWCIEVDLDN